MRNRTRIVVFCIFFICFLFDSSPVFSGENCSQLGGTCRTACGQNEESAAGAFEDCTEQQQCCVAGDAAPKQLQCCVFSFDAKKYGASNCGLPENNTCSKGAGNPAPCSTLTFCKQAGSR
jgi:hypothetical protein